MPLEEALYAIKINDEYYLYADNDCANRVAIHFLQFTCKISAHSLERLIFVQIKLKVTSKDKNCLSDVRVLSSLSVSMECKMGFQLFHFLLLSLVFTLESHN